MEKGIRFKFKDGSEECYNMMVGETNFKETKTLYVLDTHSYYTISKKKVESYSFYDLCDKCGREIYKDGCHYCDSRKDTE